MTVAWREAEARLVLVAGEITLRPPRVGAVERSPLSDAEETILVTGEPSAAPARCLRADARVDPPALASNDRGGVDLDRLLGFGTDDDCPRLWSPRTRARWRAPPWLRGLGRMSLVFVAGLGLGLWLGHSLLCRCGAPPPDAASAAPPRPAGTVAAACGQ
jgi:hypothetical protein